MVLKLSLIECTNHPSSTTILQQLRFTGIPSVTNPPYKEKREKIRPSHVTNCPYTNRTRAKIKAILQRRHKNSIA